jgi:hypothetical protein
MSAEQEIEMPNDNTPPTPQAEMLDSENPLGFDSAAEIEPAFNMRQWVEQALVAKGAKQTGAGIGFGEADIDIELEGCRYNIRIKAIMR